MASSSEKTNKIINSIRKINNLTREAAKAAKMEDDFINNYRAIIDERNTPNTSSFSMDGKTMSNKLTFRNAKVGEKTGLQKISLLKSNGDKEDVFLIVPERESVGYGEIRGWGSPDDQNMYLTKELWKSAAKSANRLNATTGSRSATEGGATLMTPLAAVGDILASNTIRNNVTKNERSNYTGTDKAVGLGNADQSEGQIFGMIASDGEMITPQETQSFLTNLKKNGYKGVAEIEQPEKVQEHTGPAYVPGDILLGFLGLQPNRGSVGYTFKKPSKNSQYKSFVNNLRNAKKANK